MGGFLGEQNPTSRLPAPGEARPRLAYMAIGLRRRYHDAGLIIPRRTRLQQTQNSRDEEPDAR
jgi:hypothetical protein